VNVKEVLNGIFSRKTRSKDEAKQRLKFLLIHDQVDLTPAQLDAMKTELLEVIQRYVEIDPQHCELKLARGADSIELVSSVPVQRVIKRPAPAA
jgi:cell division topological specificity factor